ncbi:synaptonemal complex protein 1 [Maledivibacter halophilus]|nr:hypothetical protein [Maledivibacter halophilus]
MNKKNIALIAVLVIVVAGLAMIPAIKNYMITKDPINHIMYSSVQTGKEKNVNATISIKTELDEKLALEQGMFNQMSQDPEAMAKFANSLLKNFEILYDINMITDDDKDIFKMDAGLGINYSGKTLIDGNFYLKPWELGIKAPKLYEKPFYVDFNEVIKEEGHDINLNDIDFKAYIDLIQKEDELYKAVAKNYEPYRKVVYDYLDGKVEKLDDNKITLNVYGQEKEIKGTKYKLNIDILSIYDLYADILEVAKKDENVKALVQARVKELKELVINNKDYEKFGITEEEFNEGMKELEDEINNNWDKGMDTLIAEFKSFSDMPELEELKNFDSEFILAIDKEHMIRQFELGMQTEFLKINEVVSYNAFGDDVKVNIEENAEDKINIMELETNQALVQEIGKEVVTNLGSELIGGEAVEALVSDIKTESKTLPAEESQQIVNSVEMMLSQAKLLLPMMLNEIGM